MATYIHLYMIELSSIISAQVTFESSVVSAPSSLAREAWATLMTVLPALTLQAQEEARTEGGRTQRERYRLLTSRSSILIMTETERRLLYSSQEQRFVSQHLCPRCLKSNVLTTGRNFMNTVCDERQWKWCCMVILSRDNIRVTQLCKFLTAAIVLTSLVDCLVTRF